MNSIQAQDVTAPHVQQQNYVPMNQPNQGQNIQQGYVPMNQPNQGQNMQQNYVPTTQQVQSDQSTNFYGATVNQQDLSIVGQIYQAACTQLSLQLSDEYTVHKSLYFGARDLFKTLYVNQVSSQRGSKATTPDYELASNIFENTFGSVGQPKVNQIQLCLAMKAFAPNILPDCVPGNRPHQAILDHILTMNWHSQNVRTNNNVGRNSNSADHVNNPYPLANGNAQSKAAAASRFTPQQTAQNVVGAMPNYNYA